MDGVELERAALAHLDLKHHKAPRRASLERETHLREEARPQELIAGLLEPLVIDIQRLALLHRDVSPNHML